MKKKNIRNKVSMKNKVSKKETESKPDLATESLNVWMKPERVKGNKVTLNPGEILIPVEEYAIRLEGFRTIFNKDKLVLALKFNKPINVVVYIPNNVTEDEYQSVEKILGALQTDFPKLEMISVDEYIKPLKLEMNTIRNMSKLNKEKGNKR